MCRRRRRKNRRRKNKDGRGQRPPHEDDTNDDDDPAVDDPEEDDDNQDGGEVMFDDQINHRTIERVDVDPLGHRHLFMPVVEGRVEGDDHFGVGRPGLADKTNPETEMKELEKEIEHDLEKELAGKERTAPRNKMGEAGTSGAVVVSPMHWTLWAWAWACAWAWGLVRGYASSGAPRLALSRG